MPNLLRNSSAKNPFVWVKKAITIIYHDRPYTRLILQQAFSISHQTLDALSTAEVPDHSERLKRIESETLVVAGDRERIGPECAGSSLIYWNIPKATMAVIHDAFDPVTVMKYNTFNRLALAFLLGRELPQEPDIFYYTKL